MTRVDPADVTDLRRLGEAFDALRTGRSYATLGKAAAHLPPRDGRRPALPSSTLSDLLNGKSVPSKDTVLTFLAVCGVDTRDAQQPWLAAWERAATAYSRQPVGAVRVSDARPRLLGVHAAIQVDAAADTELPAYIPRDLDPELRAALGAAAPRGGLVLLVGDSSTGKSRTLFEAVRAGLPHWWLLHPVDTAGVGTFAAAPTPCTVLWLDELQDHLDGPGSLTAGTVRELITAGTVVVATLWQHEYAERTTPEAAPDGRQLLGLATVVHVPDAFTAAERDRAEALAAEDPRIRVALDTVDAGVTQVLAGGPQLVERWNSADPYARAVLTAAVDAARLGVHAPVPPALLRDAAPGYCTDVQRAQAPADWFDRALAHLTQLLLGAVAPLAPVADGAKMGVTAGYRVADYLRQHLAPGRAWHCPPATFWDACVAHVVERGDLERVGHAADTRMRYRYAIPLLHRADPRDPYLAERLGWLLINQGRIDEGFSIFRDLARTDPLMAYRLPGIEASRDSYRRDVPSAETVDRMRAGLAFPRELNRQLSDRPPAARDAYFRAMFQLTDLDELGPRARDGDINAAAKLVILLATYGAFDEVLPLLCGLVDHGAPTMDEPLIAVLVELGHTADAYRLACFGLTADGRIDSPVTP